MRTGAHPRGSSPRHHRPLFITARHGQLQATSLGVKTAAGRWVVSPHVSPPIGPDPGPPQILKWCFWPCEISVLCRWFDAQAPMKAHVAAQTWKRSDQERCPHLPTTKSWRATRSTPPGPKGWSPSRTPSPPKQVGSNNDRSTVHLIGTGLATSRPIFNTALWVP